jgi:hypothetical protein
MITKTQLYKTIEEMPEEFSFDDFLDKILLIQKIELGIEQSDNSETFNTEEAKEQLAKWLK